MKNTREGKEDSACNFLFYKNIMGNSFENFKEVMKTKKHIDPAIVFDEADRCISFKEKREEEKEKEAIINSIILKEIVSPLSEAENARIIDRFLHKGSSFSLAEDFKKHSEKIREAEKIVPDNSARHFLLNAATGLSGSVRFIRESDTAEKKKRRMDKFKPQIIGEFNFLRRYLHFLQNFSEFRNQELGSVNGYLGREKIIEIAKEVENPITRKERYLADSAEMLKKSGSKRKSTVH